MANKRWEISFQHFPSVLPLLLVAVNSIFPGWGGFPCNPPTKLLCSSWRHSLYHSTVVHASQSAELGNTELHNGPWTEEQQRRRRRKKGFPGHVESSVLNWKWKIKSGCGFELMPSMWDREEARRKSRTTTGGIGWWMCQHRNGWDEDVALHSISAAGSDEDFHGTRQTREEKIQESLCLFCSHRWWSIKLCGEGLCYDCGWRLLRLF